jgi:hypothetical protein
MADFYLHPEKIGGDYYLAPTDAPTAGDTTAPTLTAASATATGQTTATGAVTTNEAGGTLYWLANTSATATAAQVKAGSSKAVTAAGAQSVSLTGLAAGTLYYLHFLHADGAATLNESAVANTASFTTQSAGDTAGPVMQGAISFTKTSTTTDISWPAATDAVGVTEYFVSKDGGAAVSTGLTRSKSFTGLAPLTAHQYEVTARDAVGNVSSNSLSVTVVTDAASTDPDLVEKSIVITLKKSKTLELQVNVGGIYWTWSDARGQITSSGGPVASNASGVVSVPIRTRLLSDGVGMLTLDNYNGGNPLTYFGFVGPVRVP